MRLSFLVNSLTKEGRLVCDTTFSYTYSEEASLNLDSQIAVKT
jgi:hypothetical protein